MGSIKKYIARKIKTKPLLAVLIDPDKFNIQVVLEGNKYADLFFVGGSDLKFGLINKIIPLVKKKSKLPVIIFPGHLNQLDKNADAMFIPCLLSGRNPEYLIGQHVDHAKAIKSSSIETISLGYILVDGNAVSTTQKITHTKPLSGLANILKTAIAGQLLGMDMIYLEAGSGASSVVNMKTIKAVKRNIDLPVIVGGGINSYKKAKQAKDAGSDIVVVGNALEKNVTLLKEISRAFL